MKTVPGLLLLLSLTAGPSISLAELCSHEVLLTGVNSSVSIGLSRTPSDLYVRPDPGFQGVSVEVGTSDGKNYSAFFPNQDECFQDEADFWQIQVATGSYDYTSDHVSHSGLYIRMMIAKCHSLCYYIATVDEIDSFIITGHGASAWRRSAPDPSCKTVKITAISGNKAVPCKPYTSQTTDTTTTTTPAATKSPATTTTTRLTTTTRPPTTTRHTTTTRLTTTTRPPTTTRLTTTTRPPKTTRLATTTRPPTTTRLTRTTRPPTTTRLATTTPRNTIPNPTLATRPTIPTPETTASPTTPTCTESTLSALVAVVVVLVVVLAVVVVVTVRLALRVKALKVQLTAQRPTLHQVSSGGAGGAVVFSSLQEDSRLMGHRRDYRSPLYPSLGTLKAMPQ